MLAGQLLEGHKGIVDKDIAAIAVDSIFLLVDNGVVAAFLQGHGSKLVAVERRTFQGDEDTALGTVAAVGGHYRMLL